LENTITFHPNLLLNRTQEGLYSVTVFHDELMVFSG
jgi:hypothetical protein